MKKSPYIIGGIGFIIFGSAASCDFSDYPIIAIPIIGGAVLMLIGASMESHLQAKDEDYFSNIVIKKKKLRFCHRPKLQNLKEKPNSIAIFDYFNSILRKNQINRGA